MTADQRKKLEQCLLLLQNDIEWTHEDGCCRPVHGLIREVLSEPNPFTNHWRIDERS